MNRVQRWTRNFFGFTRSQTNGFVILLPLMTVVIFSEPAYRWWLQRQQRSTPGDHIKLDSLVALWDTPRDAVVAQPRNGIAARRAFNPNQASAAQLQAAGFSPMLAQRIERYVSKGGRFRVKRDLLKIYGLDSAFYHSIAAYIQLPENPGPTPRRVSGDSVSVAFRKNGPRAPIAFAPFDLNQADTAQLKKIRGIGDKLSVRIVAYREKLGGFVDVAQVREVYGLDSAVVDKLMITSFVAENFIPKKMAVNTAGLAELSTHPYLSKPAAKAIVAYRFQHGDLRSFEDLAKIQALDAKTIQKITPYLEFNTK